MCIAVVSSVSTHGLIRTCYSMQVDVYPGGKLHVLYSNFSLTPSNLVHGCLLHNNNACIDCYNSIGRVDPRSIIMMITFILTCILCIGVFFFGWFQHLLPTLRSRLGKVSLKSCYLSLLPPPPPPPPSLSHTHKYTYSIILSYRNIVCLVP